MLPRDAKPRGKSDVGSSSSRPSLLQYFFVYVFGLITATIFFSVLHSIGFFEKHTGHDVAGFVEDLSQSTLPGVPQGGLQARPRPFALLLGDSLTQRAFDVAERGWAAQLSDWYSRRMDVVNRGFSGYNSRWVLHILPRVLREVSAREGLDCRLVTLWLGANDAVVPAARQYVPLDEFKRNIERILATVSVTFPQALLVLLTPPPANTEAWASHRTVQHVPLDREPGRSAEYAQAVREVASSAKVALVDVHAKFGGEDGSEAAPFLIDDGVHLGPKGSDVVIKSILDVVKARRNQLLPANMRQDFVESARLGGESWPSLLDNA